MPDNEIRDQLADLLAAHLYDRGQRVAEWPEDERELHRDHGAWTCFADRHEKVQTLRYRKAADELLAAGWRPPARVIETAEECAALPVGTIVLDKFGAGCTRVHRDPLIGWVRATSALRSRMGHQQHAPWLPATVLHMPEGTNRA